MKNEEDKFPWSGLFFVTAGCCFLFSFILRSMDGVFPTWLLIMGAGAGVLGLLSLTIQLIDRHHAKKRRDNRFAS